MSPNQIRASHILLMYKGSMRSTAARSKDEALATVEGVLAQLAGGANFADMARQHSDCPSSEEGGDLGSFPKGAMIPAFEKAAFALEPGETSGIVETAFGYHLIQRTE
ncbi:MAG: peptidyl-prolyl cis-trans isomerase [Magnetospirillum sp.]|nr:peptidyl-prolyl cis-trans isomerase [Magnetospirillum sp.]